MEQEPKIKGEPTQEDGELYQLLHYMIANGEDISNFAKALKGESTDQYIKMVSKLSNEQRRVILEAERKITEAKNSLREVVEIVENK